MNPAGTPYRPVPNIPVLPGRIEIRNSVVQILLAWVTCGGYAIWRGYTTTKELKEATNDPSLNPTTDLILMLVTCWIWLLVVEYRNCQKIHAILAQVEPMRKDQSTVTLLLNIFGFSFVSTYLYQEELNALARAADSGALTHMR